MTSDPLADAVSSQYQRWMYPEPIIDLPTWLATNWQWFDPSHAHRMFWPDRDHADDLDILVAGCGTNQAAVLAYTNPDSRVVAVDVSRPSLEHHGYLKRRFKLRNLDLHLLPIEDVASLDCDFDLIVSTGVLHHLADPAAGMAALGGCLRPDGVIAVMLYARYGRIGVEMLQANFREMGLQQDAASLQIVKDTLAALPASHPVQAYLAIAPDLKFDAGLVDTFLHGRERSYTVDECRELVASAGLVFDDWFLKTSYYPPVEQGDAAGHAICALPVEAQWAVMERINAQNGCHFFTASRPDRDPTRYRVDFTGRDFLGYVPSLRYRCEVNGLQISRYDWSTPLDPTQVAVLGAMDGRRTIGDMLREATTHEALAHLDGAAREDYCRNLFQSLWQLDFVAMGR